MAQQALVHDDPLSTLNFAFLLNNPLRAARKIESMKIDEAVDVLHEQPVYAVLPVLANISPGVVDAILLTLPEDKAIEILIAMDAGPCAALLSRIEEDSRERFMSRMDKSVVKVFR